jgi:hypothetical protein
MFFGQKQSVTETSNNPETDIPIRDFNPSEGLPGALPAGVIRLEEDKWNALPEDIRQQLANIDFSGIPLKRGLKETIEEFQKNNTKPIINAPPGTPSTFSLDNGKKVAYAELTSEQRLKANAALKQLTELSPEITKPALKVAPNSIEDFDKRINAALDKLENTQGVPEAMKRQLEMAEGDGIMPATLIKHDEATTPTDTKPTVTEPVTSQSGATTICPHCLRDTTQVAVEISEQNKNDFLTAVITGKPYLEQVSLFNGRIIVELKSLTTDESDLNLIAIEKFKQNPDIPDIIKPSLFNRVMLASYVNRIQIGHDRLIDLPKVPIGLRSQEECCQILSQRFDMIKNACHSVDMINILIDACYRFYDRYRRMQGLATNSNFWQPTLT